MFVLYLFVKVKLTIVLCSIIFIQWNNYQSKCIFSLKLGICNIIFLFFVSEVENLPTSRHGKARSLEFTLGPKVFMLQRQKNENLTICVNGGKQMNKIFFYKVIIFYQDNRHIHTVFTLSLGLLSPPNLSFYWYLQSKEILLALSYRGIVGTPSEWV